MTERLTLSVLSYRFAICRQPAGTSLPAWLESTSWYSVTRTEDELSLVVSEEDLPAGTVWDAEIERGWRGLKVHGPLDFNMTGVLANLSGPLADAGISIFAISTYETDYLLVRAGDLDTAIAVLRECGYVIRRDTHDRD